MKAQSRIVLAATLLTLVGLVFSATALAKPLFCEFQCYWPYYHGPGDYCTCEQGTNCYGTVLTCAEYFEGDCADSCGGAFMLTALQTGETVVCMSGQSNQQLRGAQNASSAAPAPSNGSVEETGIEED